MPCGRRAPVARLHDATVELISRPVAGQDWPLRRGLRKNTQVRKLREQEADRSTYLWRKVEVDRPPSDGPYYTFERKALPRNETWDVLLQQTGISGIHF